MAAAMNPYAMQDPSMGGFESGAHEAYPQADTDAELTRVQEEYLDEEHDLETGGAAGETEPYGPWISSAEESPKHGVTLAIKCTNERCRAVMAGTCLSIMVVVLLGVAVLMFKGR